MKDPVLELAKVGSVNAAALAASVFTDLEMTLRVLLLTASLIYTCAKIWEIIRGKGDGKNE